MRSVMSKPETRWIDCTCYIIVYTRTNDIYIYVCICMYISTLYAKVKVTNLAHREVYLHCMIPFPFSLLSRSGAKWQRVLWMQSSLWHGACSGKTQEILTLSQFHSRKPWIYLAKFAKINRNVANKNRIFPDVMSNIGVYPGLPKEKSMSQREV
jgi:hypothetical protein